MLALQPRGCHSGDEELRTVGAVAHAGTGIGHSQQVGVGEGQGVVDLVVEGVAGAAGTVT